jgi:zinc knuckle protein
MQHILGRTSDKDKGKTDNKRRWNFQPRKDLNAMDVDTISKTINAKTAEEHEKFMKQGLCFRCKKPGHISKDCPTKAGITPSSSSQPPPYVPKKMNAKELTAHIRSLTALLNQEEKEEFLDVAEQEGF